MISQAHCIESSNLQCVGGWTQLEPDKAELWVWRDPGSLSLQNKALEVRAAQKQNSSDVQKVPLKYSVDTDKCMCVRKLNRTRESGTIKDEKYGTRCSHRAGNGACSHQPGRKSSLLKGCGNCNQNALPVAPDWRMLSSLLINLKS